MAGRVYYSTCYGYGFIYTSMHVYIREESTCVAEGHRSHVKRVV